MLTSADKEVGSKKGPKHADVINEWSLIWWCQNFTSHKGQTNSNWFFQADVSSKKRTNKFNFTTRQLVFVRFLEESEDTKKTFWN